MANPPYVKCRILRLGAETDGAAPPSSRIQLALTQSGGVFPDNTIFTVVPEVKNEVLAVALTAVSTSSAVQASVNAATSQCFGLVFVAG